MATVSERRARRQVRVPASPAEHKPRRRWRRRLLAVGAILLTIVLLLPTIVSRTPLSNWLVSRATADLHGSVSVGAIHMGWFSAPVLESAAIRDAQGRSLLEVDELRLSRSLLSLLLNLSDLGRIHLEKPVLNVVYDGSGTNLEEVFAEYINADGAATNVDLEMVVAGGTVALTDIRSVKAWQICELDLTAKVSADQGIPIDVRAAGRIAEARQAGRFSLEVAWNRQASRDDPLASIEALEAEVENTPLEMLVPVIHRSMPGLELSGRLSAFAKCEVTGGRIQPEMAIQLTTVVEDFVLAGEGLNGDRVALDRVEIGGRASWRDRLVDIERLRLDTQLGNALVIGGFNLPDDSIGTLLKSLAEQTYHIEAGVNLAALAACLPNTLRLQQGMRIESGDASLVLESRRQGSAMRWDGQVDVNRLAAVRQGRRINWPEPIHASLSASKDSQGLTIDHFDCRAKHLRFDVSGTPQRVDATIDFHLAGLAEEISQFVDMGDLKVSGDGHGQLRWRLESPEQYAAEGELQIDDFGLAKGEAPGWSEKMLRLTGTARGPAGESQQVAVDTAEAQLDVGADQLTAVLARPVGDLLRARSCSVDVKTQGDLGRWTERLKPLVLPDDWQMAGQMTAAASFDCGAGTMAVRTGNLRVKELVVRSPQVNFYDPETELSVEEAEWLPAENRLDIRTASFLGTTLGAGAEPMSLIWDDGQLSGGQATVAIRTTLDRLQQWTTATVTEPPSWLFQGKLSGRTILRFSDGRTEFDSDATVEEFSARSQSGKRLEEEKIRLTAEGEFDHEAQTVLIESAQLESKFVGADTAGKLELRGKDTHVDLDGQYRYDLVSVSELGRTYLNLPLFAAGRGESPFSYHGPLSPGQATGSIGLEWTGAELLGFLIGPGQLDAQLGEGAVRTNPIRLNVSEGRMVLSPRVTFAEDGAVLQVESGQVAERIRISPRMCAGALQYIAPALAGVAAAEGTFSIELDRCRIPLGAPEKGDLAGRMTVHAVSIGPGPLIRELATALGFGRTAQLSRESTVPFRMVDGRVYHRDLQLVFPEVTMKTYGSVGLDQSLALIVEMPIPDKWRTGNQVLDRAVQNRSIRLPVGGSLQKPEIDRRELERQAGQFLHGAVRNVIEDQLNRQLERLLIPKSSQ